MSTGDGSARHRLHVATVTIAHGRHRHLERQQEGLLVGDRVPDTRVVVAMADPVIADLVDPRTVVVEHDADPARLPLAAARNLGLDRAFRAGADVAVVLDVDVVPGRSLVGGYVDAHGHDADRVWSGPVTYLPPGVEDHRPEALERHDAPHPARPAPAPGTLLPATDPALFWSLSFSVGRETWSRGVRFDERFTGYGGEDTDFAFRLERAGVGLGWAGSARGFHQWHPTQDPPVQHLADILRNGRLFAATWGRWPMTGWLEAFADWQPLTAPTPTPS